MEVDAHEPQRDQHLWFQDGNIVLQAGNSQFRVYRGILAARSPVFQDMFTFPQPAECELVDRCPLVRLHDSAADAAVFLRAIFDTSFFRPFPFPTEFNAIAGCLRLGHKYGVDDLRRSALIHLSSAYRTTLAEADCCFYDYSTKNRLPSEIVSWTSNSPAIAKTFRIYVLELAREVQALWIMPLAFYNLSVAFTELTKDILRGTCYNGNPTSLSDHDREAFLTGHHIQGRRVTTDILRFLSYPLHIEGCTSLARCSLERLRVVDIMREEIRYNPSDPLDLWEPDDWSLLGDICPMCLAALKETHAEAREAFWNKLPEIYGLPNWQELERMKVEAIGSDWLA